MALCQGACVNGAIAAIVRAAEPAHEAAHSVSVCGARLPSPLLFDAENSLHMDFIVAAANLRAQVCCPYTL